jgi:hypothetical protein
MREIRCTGCGAINRVGRFFVSSVARCGACKIPLPEPRYIRFLRPFYRWRRVIPFSLMGLGVIGLVVSAEWDSWMLGLACSAQKRPAHGLFARYLDQPAEIPFMITSSAGSDYFVKFSTTTGNPVVTFYVHGGEDLRALMPAGTFVEKDAAGDKWCGERNLFGASTTIEEGTHWVTLVEGHFYTLKLTKRANGNFPSEPISSQQF